MKTANIYYTDKDKVMESKIPRIVKKLSESTLTRKLIMSSYIPFEMKVLAFDPYIDQNAINPDEAQIASLDEVLGEPHLPSMTPH